MKRKADLAYIGCVRLNSCSETAEMHSSVSVSSSSASFPFFCTPVVLAVGRFARLAADPLGSLLTLAVHCPERRWPAVGRSIF